MYKLCEIQVVLKNATTHHSLFEPCSVAYLSRYIRVSSMFEERMYI